MRIVLVDARNVVLSWAEVLLDAPLQEGWQKVPDDVFPEIGGTWDGKVHTPPPVKRQALQSRDFLRLFTPTQFRAVDRLRLTDDRVHYFMALATAGNGIDLAHPETLLGLQLLVSLGALTAQEAQRIASGVRPPAA